MTHVAAKEVDHTHQTFWRFSRFKIIDVGIYRDVKEQVAVFLSINLHLKVSFKKEISVAQNPSIRTNSSFQMPNFRKGGDMINF